MVIQSCNSSLYKTRGDIRWTHQLSRFSPQGDSLNKKKSISTPLCDLTLIRIASSRRSFNFSPRLLIPINPIEVNRIRVYSVSNNPMDVSNEHSSHVRAREDFYPQSPPLHSLRKRLRSPRRSVYFYLSAISVTLTSLSSIPATLSQLASNTETKWFSAATETPPEIYTITSWTLLFDLSSIMRHH